MRELIETATRRPQQRLGALWEQLGLYLQALHLLPTPPEAPDHLADAIQAALPPVEPSAAFRENLRHNLAFAAQRSRAGLMIERPKPLREAFIFGLAGGLMALLAALTILVLRAHWLGPHGERPV